MVRVVLIEGERKELEKFMKGISELRATTAESTVASDRVMKIENVQEHWRMQD